MHVNSSKIVVLFWFYKEFEICRDRLKFFKLYNPNVEIYGLFGGETVDLNDAKKCTSGLVNDFFHYERQENKRWKWEHGDEMLIDWFRCQGKNISFDSVFVLQWDMLLFSSIDKIVGSLTPNQAILSGNRELAPLKSFWPWYDENKNQKLATYLSNTFNYEGPLYACLFIVVVLPRKFFEYFNENEYPFEAFLEYKIPSILAAMSIEIIENEQVLPYWYAEHHTHFVPSHKRNLIAVGHGIDLASIAYNVKKEDGLKVFHPVFIPNDEVSAYIKRASRAKVFFSLFCINAKQYCRYLIKRFL